MEDDLNIFENRRRTQFFSNGRQLQFCSRQPRELIFGMQHRFSPTSCNSCTEDDINLFEKGRATSFF